MRQEEHAERKRRVEAVIEAAIFMAEQWGFVVTVESIPEAPLAMGNYQMVSTVRERVKY